MSIEDANGRVTSYNSHFLKSFSGDGDFCVIVELIGRLITEYYRLSEKGLDGPQQKARSRESEFMGFTCPDHYDKQKT